MFVDQAIITVTAGNGGGGHVSFRRQKFEPKGGPDGGDGGRGGDIILRADSGLNTLLDFRGRPEWESEHGEAGRKKQQHGKDGKHLVIRLPAGTLIFDNKSGQQLTDLGPGQEFVAARGGHGGFGNEHYKSSTNQAPTNAHPGQAGETRELRLELKLLADVGLLGMPNAGKSTLLAALTKATPKIADYPFTTLSPQLGVAELDPTRRLVIADIPGLIEGASSGAGLGIEFLRHIERTKVLVHLLEINPSDGSNPADNYRIIRKELYQHSPVLAEREEIICLNKLDLLPDDEARQSAVKKLRADLKLGRDVAVLPLSGAARIGTRELMEYLWKIVKLTARAWDAPPTAPVEAERTPTKAAAPKASGKALTKDGAAVKNGVVAKGGSVVKGGAGVPARRGGKLKSPVQRTTPKPKPAVAKKSRPKPPTRKVSRPAAKKTTKKPAKRAVARR